MSFICALQIAIRDVMPEATITAFDCEHCLYYDKRHNNARVKDCKQLRCALQYCQLSFQ